MEKLKLKFIGTNGSMGMTTGQIYTCRVDFDSDGLVQMYEPIICPYSSVRAFYQNWGKVDMKSKTDIDRYNRYISLLSRHSKYIREESLKLFMKIINTLPL